MPQAIEYIHAAAQYAGKFGTFTTTSGGSTTTLICSTLTNSGLTSTGFGGFGVLIESGTCLGQMGFVTPTGFDKATGTLTVADAFTATIATSVSFSLYDTKWLPPLGKVDKPGWFDVLNEALALVWIEDTISTSGVTGQIHYTVDTTTHPWWTDDTRIIDIQNPVTNSDYVPSVLPRSAWSWVSDGETRKLRFPGAPFQTGESFTVKVNRPGNSRLKIGGSWADQTTQTAGLVAITDEAIPDVRFVRLLMLALACEHLAEMGAPGATVAEWLAKGAQWRERAVSMKRTRLPRDPSDGVIRLESVRAGVAW